MNDKHARRRARVSAREAKRQLADAGIDKPASLWLPPSKAECDASDELPIQVSDTTRVTVVMSHLDGRLVYYAMMHDVFSDGEWRNVTRIDCSHGTVHQHRFSRKRGASGESRAEIQSLCSADDVHATYDASYSLIFDNLDENERRWRDD